jgi:hypothetical protein
VTVDNLPTTEAAPITEAAEPATPGTETGGGTAADEPTTESVTFALDSAKVTSGIVFDSATKTTVGDNWYTGTVTLNIKISGTIAQNTSGGKYDASNSTEISTALYPIAGGQSHPDGFGNANEFAVVNFAGLLPAAVDTNETTKAYKFATIINKAFPAWYAADWIATGRHIYDRANGKCRWTASGVNPGTPTEAGKGGGTIQLGTNLWVLIWKNDPNKFVKIQLDGDDGATGAHGYFVTVDFSGVTWS